MAKTQRNSAIELLRIVALISIMWMHDALNGTTTPVGSWMRIGIDSIANTGVTIFILISGYYGIRRNAKKLLSLWFMLAFYSYSTLAVRIWLEGMGGLTIEEIGRYMLPIIGRQGWFFTCYFILAILSPWINRIAESLTLLELRKLLVLLVIIFDLITTIFFYDFTLDGGKGIVNMGIIYLIGRYLRKREEEGVAEKSRSTYFLGFLIFFGIDFILNGVVHLLTGGVYNKFARDNSILILMEAIFIFLFVKSFVYEKEWINRVARKVPAVFKMETVLRMLFYTFVWDYTVYRPTSYYQFLGLAVAIVLFAIGILVESLRVFLFHGFENTLTALLCKIARPFYQKIQNFIE